MIPLGKALVANADKMSKVAGIKPDYSAVEQQQQEEKLGQEQRIFYAFCKEGYNEEKKTWNYPRLLQFVCLERPTNKAISHLTAKYPWAARGHGLVIDSEEDKGSSMVFGDERVGVAIKPVSFSITQERQLPKGRLSEANLAKLAEQIRSEGGIWLGEIPGRLHVLEMIAAHYYHRTMNDYDFDRYMKVAGGSPHTDEAKTILHPFKPFDGGNSSRIESRFEEGENVWFYTAYYDDLDFFCGRSNCPYCLEPSGSEGFKQASEKLRKATLDRMKKLRKIAQIAFMNMSIMLMTPPPMVVGGSSGDDDDNNDYYNVGGESGSS